MKIEIVSRWDNDKILLCGEYSSIKDCLEKNADVYLGGANLRGADLGGANLGGANLRGADLRGADLRGADLRGADLVDAYLGGANLGGADLRGADLVDAYLGGAKEYVSNHDFFIEIIRRQKLETFTEKEWTMIGQVYVHRFCWDTIKKRYGKKIMPLFKKLAKEKYNEWEIKYSGILKG